MRGEVYRTGGGEGQQSVSGGEVRGDFKGVFSTWELDFFQTQRISALERPSRTSGRYLSGWRPAPGSDRACRGQPDEVLCLEPQVGEETPGSLGALPAVSCHQQAGHRLRMGPGAYEAPPLQGLTC